MKLTRFLYFVFWAAFVLNLAVLVALPIWFFGWDYNQNANEPIKSLWMTAGFLEFCGACTAFLLWQAKGVLRNLTKGLSFVMSNAVYVRRGAWPCFAIAVMAAVRAIAHALWSGSWSYILFEYNTLFIPVFTIAGLLCLVVAKLFYSAAVLKEDNDLVV